MSVTRRATCVFCGGTPVNREHVFPRWMSRALRNRGAKQFILGMKGVTYRSGEINLTVRQFCESCNSGWMAALERATQPILAPMLLNTDLQVLSEEDQATLATWAYKTALVLMAHEHPGSLPDRWFETFYRERQPIGGVYLGTYGGERRQGRYNVQAGTFTPTGATPPTEPNLFVARFSVFKPVFTVVGYLGGSKVGVNDRSIRESFYRLSPPDRDTVEWPHPVQIDDETIDAGIPVDQTLDMD